MRPIASICCSPPESFVPWLRKPLLEIREELEDLRDRQSALAHDRRQQQVLLDVEAREDPALLRAVRDAALRDPVGSEPHDLLALEQDRPFARGTTPMIDRSVVVLPAPLRPRSVTTSPAATSNVTPCSTCDSPYQALSARTARSGAARRSAPLPMRWSRASGIGGPMYASTTSGWFDTCA
jgi:hypothetical protein